MGSITVHPLSPWPKNLLGILFIRWHKWASFDTHLHFLLSTLFQFILSKSSMYLTVTDILRHKPHKFDNIGLKQFCICVTKALNIFQKCPNMMLNGKFSQPYGQYPVCVWAYERSSLSPVIFQQCLFAKEFNKICFVVRDPRQITWLIGKLL